jgi:type I restriction enzyme, S subunit
VTTKIGSGATPLGGETAYKSNGISLIRSLNVHDGVFRMKDLAFIDPDQAARLGNVVIEPDDVLLNITGASVARCCVVPANVLPARVNQHVAIVRTQVGRLLPQFLQYALVAPEYKDRLLRTGEGAGSTRQALTKAQLQSFVVEIPSSVAEQRRIVAILDEAFEGIATAKANAEKNLRNARELFESRREEVLSGTGTDWHEAPLGDLCDIKHGYAFEGEFFSSSGDYVLLTPGNYFESGGYRDRGSKQKYFVGPIPRGYVLSEGALLVAMTEQAAGLLGSPLLVPEPDRFLHNQRLGLVVGKPGVPWLNDFFFNVFNLKRVRDEIHASASGVKVRHTSPGKIGAVCVAYPSDVGEQRLIAAQLGELSAECDVLAAIYKSKLATLDELKKSLLHQAFSGAL